MQGRATFERSSGCQPDLCRGSSSLAARVLLVLRSRTSLRGRKTGHERSTAGYGHVVLETRYGNLDICAAAYINKSAVGTITW